MLNGSILGQKFYAARNPRWTKLGKAGKPLMGLRANNQIPGPKGIGDQGMQRSKFAHAAMANYGTRGFDGRGMPAMASKMSAALGGYHPEVSKQRQEARRASAHAAAQARWSGVAIQPSGGQGFGGYPQF
jgi:hypothetical protein